MRGFSNWIKLVPECSNLYYNIPLLLILFLINQPFFSPDVCKLAHEETILSFYSVSTKCWCHTDTPGHRSKNHTHSNKHTLCISSPVYVHTGNSLLIKLGHGWRLFKAHVQISILFHLITHCRQEHGDRLGVSWEVCVRVCVCACVCHGSQWEEGASVLVE